MGDYGPSASVLPTTREEQRVPLCMPRRWEVLHGHWGELHPTAPLPMPGLPHLGISGCEKLLSLGNLEKWL